jgi:hypothetical protein
MIDNTRAIIAKHAARLAQTPFYPADFHDDVLNELAAMVGTAVLYGSTPEQRITWLVMTAVNTMRTWQSIPELRGLYCQRWRSADGIETYCTLPGYTAQANESRAIAESNAHKAQVRAGRSQLLLNAGDMDPIPQAELEQLHGETIGALVAAQPVMKPTYRDQLAAKRFAAILDGDTAQAAKLTADLERRAPREPAERRAIREAERQIAEAKPTLTEAEKARRIVELEAGLAAHAAAKLLTNYDHEGVTQ